MKRVELIVSALLVPIDFLMIISAGFASYYLRFTSLAEVRPVLYELPFGEYVPIVLAVGVVWLGVFAVSGLYSISGTRRIVDELAKVFVACSTGVMLIIIIIFFQRELFSSRFIILAGWVLAIVLVSLARLITRLVQHSLLRNGIGIHNVIVFGSDQATEEIVEHLHRHSNLGSIVAGRYERPTQAVLAELEPRLQVKAIDEFIVGDARLTKAEILPLIMLAHDHHIVFKYAADRFDTEAAGLDIQAIAGIPIIELRRTPLDGWGKIIKRTVDISVAVIGLPIVGIIGLFIGLIIKLDSAGPIFFHSERIGQGGRHFRLLKFRSMIKDAQLLKTELMPQNERKDGPLFKLKSDPRITRVGRLLRKTSLDELPQLWNVIKGEMSLVGPRPHEPNEVAQYTRQHRKLLTIKPGITGLAQISGRSDLNFDDEVRLDIYYIEHWSLKLDCQILIKTPQVVLSAKTAS